MIRLTVLTAILAGIATFPALGQHLNTMNPVRPMPAPPNALPFGNILFPGGIPAHHTERVGGLITGSRPYTGVPPRGTAGYPGGPGRNRTVVVPYAVPVFASPYYGYADPGYLMQQPNVTVVVPQAPTPSVVINQHYNPPEPGKPVLRDYSNIELPETSVKVYEGPTPGGGRVEANEPKPAVRTPHAPRDDRPTIYLIALKDTSVRQAIGYWVEDGTLHYVTPKGSINHVTLDMVDRETSVQLNAERNLEFDLNAARRR